VSTGWQGSVRRASRTSAERLGRPATWRTTRPRRSCTSRVALGKPVLVEGPAGRRQDRAREGRRDRARRRPDPAAVLRGARRGAGAVRVGLQEAAAAHPARDRGRCGGEAAGWEDVHDDLFGEEYLLERPLLRALRAERDTVLLIDEVDKVDVEFEALLLEILSDFQVTIPELGTVRGRRPRSSC
jgi:hypothetical protein